MEEGLILTSEQVIFIINCVPDWQYVSYIGNEEIRIFDHSYDTDINLLFNNIYQIKLPELMKQIVNRAYIDGKYLGQCEKASEIRKALNIKD